MESALRIGVFSLPKISNSHLQKNWGFLPSFASGDETNGAISLAHFGSSIRVQGIKCAAAGVNNQRTTLESLFRHDKSIPEEMIEKPVGLSLPEKSVGTNFRCLSCQAKGAVLCSTCSGSGLYVDSILESQGIIVKVRCLGCGGTGNTMCAECGGRGHL